METTLTAENTAQQVQTPSGLIHYYEAGKGQPLLLLHGSGPGATGWSNFGPNIVELARRFRVIAPDMPGWGNSAPVTYEDRDHVTSLLQFLDALQIEKAAFVGNSMGGATAIKFAAMYPERATHLVSMGSGSAGGTMLAPGDGPSEGIKGLHQAYLNPTYATFRQLVDLMTFAPEFATEELVQLRFQSAIARLDHIENFAAGIGRPWTGAASLAEVQSITTPTMIIHGRDDRVLHYEHGLRLVSLIRNSRLVIFNRCGHWAQLEHADEFNTLVAEFVASR